jgi:hypothetical protein
MDTVGVLHLVYTSSSTSQPAFTGQVFFSQPWNSPAATSASRQCSLSIEADTKSSFIAAIEGGSASYLSMVCWTELAEVSMAKCAVVFAMGVDGKGQLIELATKCNLPLAYGSPRVTSDQSVGQFSLISLRSQPSEGQPPHHPLFTPIFQIDLPAPLADSQHSFHGEIGLSPFPCQRHERLFFMSVFDDHFVFDEVADGGFREDC